MEKKDGYLNRSTARFRFLLSRLSYCPFSCFPFALLILFFWLFVSFIILVLVRGRLHHCVVWRTVLHFANILNTLVFGHFKMHFTVNHLVFWNSAWRKRLWSHCSFTCQGICPFRGQNFLQMKRSHMLHGSERKINSHKGCFTTCGHYCRRWFPRSLWSKKFK